MDTARVEKLIEEHGEPTLHTVIPLQFDRDLVERVEDAVLPAGSAVRVVGYDSSGYYRLEIADGDDEGSEIEGVLASHLTEES